MHKDEAKGAAKDIKGSMKEAAGKATGNTKLKVEGKVEKAAGAAQNKLGKAEDRAR